MDCPNARRNLCSGSGRCLYPWPDKRDREEWIARASIRVGFPHGSKATANDHSVAAFAPESQIDTGLKFPLIEAYRHFRIGLRKV
jgi:hypothetical protein